MALAPARRRLNYLFRRVLAVAVAGAVVAALGLADRAGLFGLAARRDWDKYNDRQFAVVYVVDGDTLDVDCPDGRFRHTRVRLLGVDTPETKKPDTLPQRFGPEAAEFTRATAMGQTVALKLDRQRTRDKYGRLLAYVILPDGRNLDLEIVSLGYGYADPRFRHPMERQFHRAQAESMKHLRGLWKGIRDEDLPDYYRGQLKLPG
jgi:endonuclease YncB( thermonuclease family)